MGLEEILGGWVTFSNLFPWLGSNYWRKKLQFERSYQILSEYTKPKARTSEITKREKNYEWRKRKSRDEGKKNWATDLSCQLGKILTLNCLCG